ncbi:hypothetical protein D3C78_1409170 [compost metagenome]
MNIVLDNIVTSRRGASDATFDLGINNTIRHEGKRYGILISRLAIHRIPVNRTSVQSGRGPCFQTTHNKTEP